MNLAQHFFRFPLGNEEFSLWFRCYRCERQTIVGLVLNIHKLQLSIWLNDWDKRMVFDHWWQTVSYRYLPRFRVCDVFRMRQYRFDFWIFHVFWWRELGWWEHRRFRIYKRVDS